MLVKRKMRIATKMMTRVGLDSMSKAADRLKILDKVLALFKMRVGAETIELDASVGRIMSVRLTVYFIQ